MVLCLLVPLFSVLLYDIVKQYTELAVHVHNYHKQYDTGESNQLLGKSWYISYSFSDRILHLFRERPLDSQGGGLGFFWKKYSGSGFGKKKYSGLDHVWKKYLGFIHWKKKCLPSIHEKKMSALYPWKENY